MASRRAGPGRMVAWALAGAVLGAGLVAGVAAMRHRRSARDSTVRLSVSLPPGQSILLGDLPHFALARDGAQIAYVAKKESGASALCLRSMGSFDARELLGTEGATAPFFSPDGQWLGYFVGGRVQKMAVSGGPPQPVCDTAVSGLGGAAWTDDGSILVSSTSGRRRGDALGHRHADGRDQDLTRTLSARRSSRSRTRRRFRPASLRKLLKPRATLPRR